MNTQRLDELLSHSRRGEMFFQSTNFPIQSLQIMKMMAKREIRVGLIQEDN